MNLRQRNYKLGKKENGGSGLALAIVQYGCSCLLAMEEEIMGLAVVFMSCEANEDFQGDCNTKLNCQGCPMVASDTPISNNGIPPFLASA